MVFLTMTQWKLSQFKVIFALLKGRFQNQMGGKNNKVLNSDGSFSSKTSGTF